MSFSNWPQNLPLLASAANFRKGKSEWSSPAPSRVYTPSVLRISSVPAAVTASDVISELLSPALKIRLV